MDILTANQITCHIKREFANTIWSLFTNSYPWFTANLLVIYKIYVHLMFTVNYCFCQAMLKIDILIMIYFEIIQILMKHHVIACIFIKTIWSKICVRYMVNSPGISVIMFSKILFCAPFGEFFFGEVKSGIKTNQDIGISLEAANLKKKFKWSSEEVKPFCVDWQVHAWDEYIALLHNYEEHLWLIP